MLHIIFIFVHWNKTYFYFFFTIINMRITVSTLLFLGISNLLHSQNADLEKPNENDRIALNKTNLALLNTVVNALDNPAYTGLHGGHGLRFNYVFGFDPNGNSNFTGFKPFHVLSFGYDVSFKKRKRNALGFYYHSTPTEQYNQCYDAGMTYTHRIRLGSQAFIGLGLGFYYHQFLVDFSKLTYGDQIDPKFGYVFESTEQRFGPGRSFIRTDAGLLLGVKDFLAGASFLNFNRARNGFISMSKLRLHVQSFATYNIKLTHKWVLSPTIRLQVIEDYPKAMCDAWVQAVWKNKWITTVGFSGTRMWLMQVGWQPISQFRLMLAMELPMQTERYASPSFYRIGGQMQSVFNSTFSVKQ